MATVSFQTTCTNHPKIAVLSGDAFRLWFRSVGWCKEHLTDGVLPKPCLRQLGVRVTPRLIDELLQIVPPYKSPLWHDEGDHYQVHDYGDWQDSKNHVQKLRRGVRERVARHRERAAGVTDSNYVTPPVTPLQPALQGCVTTKDRQSDIGLRTSVFGHRASDAGPSSGARETSPTAGLGTHRNHASCGRVCVPAALHEELRRKVGGDEDDADRRLRAWYREVDDAWQDPSRAIGDSDWDFWRARFREWQGTTADRKRGAGNAPITPAEREKAAEWRRKCWGACRHDPRCPDTESCLRAIVLDWRERAEGVA